MKIFRSRTGIFFTTKVVFLFCFWWHHTALVAQKPVILAMSEYDDIVWTPQVFLLAPDSSKIHSLINERLLKLYASGYVHANTDSIFFTKDTCHVNIYIGSRYTIGTIRVTEEQKAILESGGIKRNQLERNIPDSSIIYGYLKALISHQVNNGFPFATANLDSILLNDKKLEASLHFEKGKKIYFDSIVSEGRLVVSHHFMKRLLDIHPGDLYSHEKVLRASKRISDLQFAQQRESPFVRFVNDKASLIISPDPKPASRFDFLIGVLPQVINGVRKWNITGDFTAELNNSFNQGEYTFFQFKRLKPENLELLIKSTIPYLGGLPAGSHIDFRLFKNGNSNLDLYFDGGLQYLFGGFNNIKLYGSYRSSVLLDVNIDQIKTSNRLPQNLDISYTGVGIGLNIRQLDYRFNPSKGYEALLNIVAGNKKIIPNRQIVDISGFETSYDTLSLKTLQLEMDLTSSYYIPVRKWAALKTSITGAIRFNEQSLRPNELMRIGGNKVLRGFDEESIFTDKYLFGTFELRILFDQNSYLTLPFIDYGFTHVDINGISRNDIVFGVGMGLNFGTPAGIFNLSFAAGKNMGNAIDFGKMKIHFGYVNLF